MPLEFHDIQYQQGDLRLEASLSFMDGTIVGLTGPNGAGKSIFLELACGLRKPDEGHVDGLTTRAIARESLGSEIACRKASSAET